MMFCSRNANLRHQPSCFQALFAHRTDHSVSTSRNNGFTFCSPSPQPFVLPIVPKINALVESHLNAKYETSHITARLTIVTNIQCICEEDESQIQRKKLTPKSNTYGLRFELNNNQKTETLLTSVQSQLA
ncbi:hypothetical protein BLNAU_21916 [Blattamonas nauphoetae]|uniref:Uncharacterized protein n=1 Tax=Blattamonas nauphoetae TaxID=2049346 RepID=A0ABQ9WV49_9EUKA|nr:hypothetical protein BLNAU_21916 [Blattamonas nauphoetae]